MEDLIDKRAGLQVPTVGLVIYVDAIVNHCSLRYLIIKKGKTSTVCNP